MERLSICMMGRLMPEMVVPRPCWKPGVPYSSSQMPVLLLPGAHATTALLLTRVAEKSLTGSHTNTPALPVWKSTDFQLLCVEVSHSVRT